MGTITSLYSNFRRVLAFHGVVGTLRLVGLKALNYILWFSPAQRKSRAAYRQLDSEFDRMWGVDTSGVALPDKAEVVGSNWIHGSKTEGCDSAALDRILGELSIDFNQYTFVDLGSGKGRAILLASRLPFRKILGVEYSEHLNDIARKNIAAFPESETRCKNIDVVCADASQIAIPDGQLLIFLYNPFGKPVMEAVVDNVLASYRQARRRIIVLYFNAEFAEVWSKDGVFEEKQISESHWLFDTGEED